jgi:hypothetical protein
LHELAAAGVERTLVAFQPTVTEPDWSSASGSTEHNIWLGKEFSHECVDNVGRR